MSKKTIAQLTGVLGGVALAMSSVVATNAVAEEQGPTVYGLFDISLQNYDMDAPGTTSDIDYWQTKSTDSRFGIKGKEMLSSALSVIYQYEVGVDIEDDSTGDSTKSGFMKARDQFVGLEGDFGTVRVGRMELPLKHAQGGVDLFPDHGPGHIDFVLDDVGEARIPNAIYYTSPTIADGIVASLALVQGETNNLDGDAATTEDGIGDAYSASVTYQNDMLFVGFGIESDIADKSGVGHDTWRLAAQYMMDALKFGALYQSSEGSATGSTERTGYVLSALYGVGDVDFRLQFGDSSEENTAGTTVEDRSSMAFGVSKHYSDTTTGYLEYVQGTVEVGSLETEETVMSAGLVKVF
jgi:predicted porin